MSEYFVGTTGANSQTNFESLTTSQVLDDLSLNTGDSPTFSGLFINSTGAGANNTLFSVDGSNGRLFGVTDDITGSIFSVNDAAGLPIIEVESTSSYDKITMGEYGSDLLVLSGQSTVEITGSQIASESWVGQQGYLTSTTSANDATITIQGGTNITTSIGDFTTNQASAETLTINHATISRSDTTSSSTIAFGGTLSAINSITSSNGHVTAENTVSYTLPSLGTTSTTALAGNTTVNDVSETNLLNKLAALDSSDTIYIGDAGDDTTVVVRGTLQVDGSTTTINSNTLSIGDNQIVLNNDVTGTPTQNAGITVERGTATNASLIWDESNDYWKAGLAGSEVQLALTNGTYSGLRAQSTTKGDVGLGNVANTLITVTSSSVSDGTNTFNKATLASLGTDAFNDAGTYANLRAQATTKGDVDLGNVTNESKATMFTSPSFTGNVGIGTNSPSNTLDISGGLEVNAEAYIRSTTNVGLRIQTTDQGTTGTDGLRVGLNATHAFVWQYENLPLAFATNGSQKATILANGNFGIGTTSPDSKLHVQGALLLQVNTSDQNSSEDSTTNPSTTTHEFMRIGHTGTYSDGRYTHEWVKLDRTGNLPLYLRQSKGTANSFENIARFGEHSYSTHRFEVFGSIAASGATLSGDLNIAEYIRHDQDSNTYLRFTADTLRLAAGGVEMIKLSEGTDDAIIFNEAGGDVDFRVEASGEANALFVRGSDGKVGIGTTSPDFQLDIENSSHATARLHAGADSSASLRLQNDAQHFDVNLQTNDKFAIYDHTAGTQPFTILPTSGNVGIGTTSPAYKLDVAGNAARIGNNLQTTTSLFLTATNTAGAPARAVQTVMAGYEGRGMGTFYTDTSYSGKEWFNGINYSGSFVKWSVGYDASGGQAEYLANAKFTVCHDGNVGIGTTSPSERLHIHNSTGNSATIRLSDPDSTSTANATGYVEVYHGENTGRAGYFGLITNSEMALATTTSAGNIKLYTGNNTAALTIDSSQRVGIGTTSPTNDLHVVGTMQLDNSVSDAFKIRLNGGVGLALDHNSIKSTNSGTDIEIAAGRELILKTYDGGFNDAVRIDTAGNVGIGTTSPAAKLDVYTSGNRYTKILGSTADLEVVSDNNTNPVALIKGTGTADLLNVFDNTTEVFTILDGGNVGIGTTDPDTELEVGGTIKASTHSDAIVIGSPTTVKWKMGVYGANDLLIRDPSNNTKLSILADGKVGIGTTSAEYELHVIGTASFTDTVAGAYFEENASNPELKELDTGTILTMDEEGEIVPSCKANDTMVFGASKRGYKQPIVMGAEPIKMTGPIKVGDFITTSSRYGHGMRSETKEVGTIIAQAMESGDGDSYNIKAMIRKM